jgi:hypothetical protein
MSDDQSAIVIPFGKHKGSTVAELLVKDPQYVEWITAQGWFAQRFAEIHAAIISRGAGTDDTPEHNALQARFLDPVFREACLRLIKPNQIKRIFTENFNRTQTNCRDAQDIISGKKSYSRYFDTREEAQKFLSKYSTSIEPNASWYLLTSVQFEISGVDVCIKWDWCPNKDEDFYNPSSATLIELKPEIGDDYPTVMRQMQRLKCNALVAQTFTGRGVSETTLCEMMEANGYSLVWVREIEAEVTAITAASRPKIRRRLKK